MSVRPYACRAWCTRATAAVHRLRAALPEPVLVTGSAAAIDYARYSADRLPWTVGAVLPA
jgi:RND superfamily putative drug exporter